MFNQDDINVAGAQKIMLEMLIEIHRICVKHKITYWLEAGTLLGAVRHKGFIPWDDDLDISMPREDFNRFLEIVENELPRDLFLQTKESAPESDFKAAKIRKTGTLLIETGEKGDENYHHGIFIDVFAYDTYDSKLLIKLFEWHSTFREKRKKYPPRSVKRFFVSFYVNIIMWIPVRLIGILKNYYKRKTNWVNNPGDKYFTYGLEFFSLRCTKKDDILPVKLLKDGFEGHSFFVPNNCDAVLRANFGSDYMSLPPVDRRKVHAKYIDLGEFK